MEMILLQRFLWIFITIICSIGLIIQIENVSIRYFSFKTRAVANMIIPIEGTYPDLSVCFRYVDILNGSKVNEKYDRINIVKYFEPGYDMKKSYLDTKNLTIKEIFEFTPEENLIFKDGVGCYIRYPGRYTMENIKTIDCYKHFKIIEYLIRNSVCYLIKPIFYNGSLTMHEYALSPGYQGQMYKLNFDESIFKNFYSMSIVVHTNRSNILFDTLFSSNIELPMEELPSTYVWAREFVQESLPKPYDTMCLPPPNNSKSWYGYMMGQIDQKAMKLYNFSIPFKPTFKADLRVTKIMNFLAFKNRTLTYLIDNLMKKYYKHITTCNTLYYVTRSKYIPDNEASFATFWTQDEKIVLRYSPEQELIDFIVYVCSCIGIWFGLSAYSFLDMACMLCRSKNSDGNDVEILKKKNCIQDATIDSLNKKCRLMSRKMILIQRFVEQLYNIVDS